MFIRNTTRVRRADCSSKYVHHVQIIIVSECVGRAVVVGVGCVEIAVITLVVTTMINAAQKNSFKHVVYFLLVFSVNNRTHVNMGTFNIASYSHVRCEHKINNIMCLYVCLSLIVICN